MKRLPAIVAAISIALAGCGEKPSIGFPSRADVQAVIAAKPKPSAKTLTDPDANDTYNSALEAWGDRISAAGHRICKSLVTQGMPGLTCKP